MYFDHSYTYLPVPIRRRWLWLFQTELGIGRGLHLCFLCTLYGVSNPINYINQLGMYLILSNNISRKQLGISTMFIRNERVTVFDKTFL